MKTKHIRIASIYNLELEDFDQLCDMSCIRWYEMARALASLGYSVDIISNDSVVRRNKNAGIVLMGDNLRRICIKNVKWRDYDCAITLNHKGYKAFINTGGDPNSFVISSLGSVVGSADGGGVYFFKKDRKELFDIQKIIDENSKYIALLSWPNRDLWNSDMESKNNVLMIPTGVPKTIPSPGKNPFGASDKRKCVYIGNIYNKRQKEINLVWQEKLNKLGRYLKKEKIDFYFIGTGNTDNLDDRYVKYCGLVNNDNIWDYHYFADVGIAFAHGQICDNESSKIYYYLRGGLPVVAERSLPNSFLIEELKFGYLVDYNNLEDMADKIARASNRKWPKKRVMEHMSKNHSWIERAKVYDEVFRKSRDMLRKANCNHQRLSNMELV